MTVECVYRSTYNKSEVFVDKNEADKYDRMLETAEHLSSMISHVLPSLSEGDAEKLSIYMAERREALAVALKKKPSAIAELIKEKEPTDNVVPLASVS